MAERIDALGQKEPVCLKLIGDGAYETVYGHRRIAALRYLDRTTALAIIRGDLEELATWTAIENTGEPLSPVEKAELADLLEKEFHYKANQIAARLGCTAREVYRFKTVLGADDAIRFALQEELTRHMADAQCGPDDAAAVFGLAQPDDGEPLRAMTIGDGEETGIIHQVDAAAESGSANETAAAVADNSRSGNPDGPANEVASQDPEPSGSKGRKPKISKRPGLALDPTAISKMLQDEQATAERANLRAVANKRVGTFQK